MLAGSLCLSVWRVWLQPLVRIGRRGRLPEWPSSADDHAPSLGELHHPTAPCESERPSWLVIPEKGLYTGMLVVGAVGTGKPSNYREPSLRAKVAAGFRLHANGPVAEGLQRKIGLGADESGSWLRGPVDRDPAAVEL